MLSAAHLTIKSERVDRVSSQMALATPFSSGSLGITTSTGSRLVSGFGDSSVWEATPTRSWAGTA